MGATASRNHTITRERSRSRFRAGVVAGLLLLAGCSNHFGAGIAGLAAEDGWQTLPINAWVLNDGIAADAMSFCPRAACAQQGFAALLTLDGREADALERQLAQDPARLARDFGPRKPGVLQKGRKPPPARPRTSTSVSRFSDGGASGLLVEISSDATGKRAATAILSAREQGRLAVAVAVATDPQKARASAVATWRSR